MNPDIQIMFHEQELSSAPFAYFARQVNNQRINGCASQLPMFLKAVYVDNWKYSEKPTQVNTREQFLTEIKKHQYQYGESEFRWQQHTEEIVAVVFRELTTYISEGESKHIVAQLPKELEEFFSESISH